MSALLVALLVSSAASAQSVRVFVPPPDDRAGLLDAAARQRMVRTLDNTVKKIDGIKALSSRDFEVAAKADAKAELCGDQSVACAAALAQLIETELILVSRVAQVGSVSVVTVSVFETKTQRFGPRVIAKGRSLSKAREATPDAVRAALSRYVEDAKTDAELVAEIPGYQVLSTLLSAVVPAAAVGALGLSAWAFGGGFPVSFTTGTLFDAAVMGAVAAAVAGFSTLIVRAFFDNTTYSVIAALSNALLVGGATFGFGLLGVLLSSGRESRPELNTFGSLFLTAGIAGGLAWILPMFFANNYTKPPGRRWVDEFE